MAIKESDYRRKFRQHILAEFSRIGRKVLKAVEQGRGYQNRTLNLYDSYGFGVYIEGKLVTWDFLSDSPMADKANRSGIPGKPGKSGKFRGREEIEKFLKAYKSSKKDFAELVIAASMPYAEFLENKGYMHMIDESNAKLVEAARSAGLENVTFHTIRFGKKEN